MNSHLIIIIIQKLFIDWHIFSVYVRRIRSYVFRCPDEAQSHLRFLIRSESKEVLPILFYQRIISTTNPSKCIYCTLCARNCPAGALTVDRKAKTWVLDEDLCVACGTCQGACPKDAIIM